MWSSTLAAVFAQTCKVYVQVVAAKMQQITMTEFLPALGITESNLHSATDPPYDSEFVSVEFATAAFRFGHDLVPDSIGPDFKTVEIFNGEVSCQIVQGPFVRLAL